MIDSNISSKSNDDLQSESLLSLSKAIDDSMHSETLATDNPFPIDASRIHNSFQAQHFS